MTRERASTDPVGDLLQRLAQYPGVLVAFSAGVDSAFLLAAAMRALPADRVLAVTAVSPSLPAAELEYARHFASEVGATHLEVRTDEMSREGYRENSTSRCYFCKAELLDVVTGELGRLPAGSVVATGTNADDLRSGFRPGIRAAAEREAVTPLSSLTKEQIRSAARAWNLTVWDKPQAACLSSRIAYGITISPARLSRVEAAEVALRQTLRDHAVPATNIRVRDLGDAARIEVDAAVLDMPGSWREEAVAAVLASGFLAAELDPRGFRSGSMNEGQQQPQL